MKLHGNGKLSPKGRLLMCRRVIEEDWSLTEAAEAAGVSERACSKWLARYRYDGEYRPSRSGRRCRRFSWELQSLARVLSGWSIGGSELG